MAFQKPVFSGDRFIGRAAELEALGSLFTLSTALPSNAPPRLLMLTGAGGSGKTRLARQLAENIRAEFADGIAWVDLAPLSDPSLIARAVLTVLDLPKESDQPPLDTLIAQLAPRQVLLILDNCEHLLEACAALCRQLLARCPELSILGTSREPLGIRGETIYPVLPLALPSGESDQAIRDSDAVELFVLRAREVLPGFQPTQENLPAIVRICSRLDGLPLAIELAAARVKMMTVGEIAERLQDAFRLLTRSAVAREPRHQTLRAAMDWSYDLLSENEQALLRRTSIFAGGFTLEAVEHVCGDAESERVEEGKMERWGASLSHSFTPSLHPSIPSSLILDLLSNLANKSLVHIAERSEGSPTRYGMLETLRQYARGKLQAAGEEPTLCVRHLQWCVVFAERAEPQLTGAEQRHWLAREDNEIANFRVALQRAIGDNAIEQGLQLANALWRYWDRRGKYSEAQSWYGRLLAGDLTQTPPRVRGRAMYRLSMMHYRLSQFDQAIRLAEASLAVARELDDRRGMAAISNLLGVIATDQGSFDRATEFYEQALALFQELDDTLNIPGVLNNFGNLFKGRGEYRHALEYYESSLDLKRQVGDGAGAAMGLNDVGALYLALGEYARAQAILQESQATHRRLGDKRGLYLNLINMARAALYPGDYATAHTVLFEAEQIGTELESKGDLAYGLLSLGELAQAQGEYAHAYSLYERALGLCREASEHVSVAQVLYHLATNALESGKVDAAGKYGAASLKLYQEQDHKPGMAAGLEVMAGVSVGRTEYVRAAQYLGAAALLREQTETLAYPHERALLDKIINASRTALGERAFRAAQRKGRTRLPSEILDAVLAATPPLSNAGAYRVEPAQPELQIQGLGQAHVLAAGKLLTPVDWTYAKSRELLFYLLTHGSATKEQIGLDLWADASPAQLRRIFHRVLFALRKALGRNEWVTFQEDVYAIQSDASYVYDVERFDSYRTEAQALLRDPARRALAIPSLQRAVELYQGDFLADVEGGDWILFRREELRKEFLEALLTLGRLHVEQKEYGQAAAVYERALEHDNFLETAHRELMRVLARQGEVSRALRQYQALAEVLRKEFGAPPSAETQALYEQLRKGESV